MERFAAYVDEQVDRPVMSDKEGKVRIATMVDYHIDLVAGDIYALDIDGAHWLCLRALFLG